MRSLGIALSARPAASAYCVIAWYADMALVELPVAGVDDGALLNAMRAADWIGVDAPFGWPRAFVDALPAYAATGDWPEHESSDLWLRETDRFIADILASEHGISLPRRADDSARAARCAALLHAHRLRAGIAVDRIGVPLTAGADGPPGERRPVGVAAPAGLVETYPTGALAVWGLPYRRCRPVRRLGLAQARGERAAILAALDHAAASWLVLSEDAHAACVANDSCLDALVSAIVACAAATDVTIRPSIGQRAAASAEGWMHLPEPDSLACLAPGAS